MGVIIANDGRSGSQDTLQLIDKNRLLLEGEQRKVTGIIMRM